MPSIMQKKAFAYLERNRVLYMAAIFPIQGGTADILYAGQDGVFIRDAESGVSFLTLDDFNRSKELMDAAGRQTHICVYQKNTADYLSEKYGFKKYVENVQTVYTKTEYVELPSRALDIRPLTLAHLDWAHEHIGHDREYLKGRLDSGAIYGGYSGCELCGSVGIHTDGSIGMLQVLDKFSRRGCASELLGYMVNTLLGRGHIPFSQIESDNEASIGLHRKLGFEISADILYRLID